MLTHVVHERLGDVHCDLVGSVVVVTEGHVAAFLFEADSETAFVANHAYLTELDSGQRVSNDRDTGDTAGTSAENVAVVECHFESLVAVLVVHVVDDAERVAVNTCQPLHHLVELLHHLFVFEIFARDGGEEGRDLLAVHFVHTTVDGIEQALRQVGTSAEELHLLTDAHGRYAASDTVVVAVVWTHQVVVLVLDGRSGDRHLRAVALPVFGKTR